MSSLDRIYGKNNSIIYMERDMVWDRISQSTKGQSVAALDVLRDG